MKVIPEYGRQAFIVPGKVLTYLKEATGAELACLLYILSEGSFDSKEAASAIGIEESEFKRAVKKWTSRGILSVKVEAGAASSEADKNVRKKTKRTTSLPAYTTEEIVKFLEGNKGTAEIIDACENIIGKIFTTAETNIIIGLLDHLSLSGEYLLLLFAHAAKMEKKSVRYVEKMALGFVDRDITSYKELESELASIELAENTLKFIRKLFGIGRRVFTEKERNIVTNWCVNWSFGNDVIEKAYEITVNATGEASLNYANAILENWHNAGLKTAEEIYKYTEEYEKKKGTKKQKNAKSNTSTPFDSSFDTDDFFEAALKRSYNDTEKA